MTKYEIRKATIEQYIGKPNDTEAIYKLFDDVEQNCTATESVSMHDNENAARQTLKDYESEAVYVGNGKVELTVYFIDEGEYDDDGEYICGYTVDTSASPEQITLHGVTYQKIGNRYERC